MRLGQYDFGQLIQDPKEGKDDSGLYPLPPRHRSVTLIGPDVQLPDDNTCLTMRSYVVARDSKDSDPRIWSATPPASPGALPREDD